MAPTPSGPRGDRAGADARLVACVGAVVHDGAGRLLVVRRGRPPGQGLWSVPGGRVEPGETEHEAVAREVCEETGLQVRVGRLAGRVRRAGLAGVVYDIADHVCEVVGGTLRAGDDAAEVRWASNADLHTLPLTEGLLDALAEWGVLPQDPAGS